MPSQRTLPVVSVVTAALNAGPALARTAASLEAQDHENIEWIVADGASTDDTVNIARASRRLTHLVSEPDRGIYDAWNKGVALAGGEWICFLGAGDVFLPGAVARYVGFIEEHARSGAAELVSSRVRLTSGGRVVRNFGRPWRWSEFRRYMCTAHCGAFHHRSLFLDPLDEKRKLWAIETTLASPAVGVVVAECGGISFQMR